jgi:hypothetical protein
VADERLENPSGWQDGPAQKNHCQAMGVAINRGPGISRLPRHELVGSSRRRSNPDRGLRNPSRNSIAPAIREAEPLGFIRVTQYGLASNAEFRIPNKFALTHLPTEDGQKAPTDDWRRIKTPEEASMIAAAARKMPARCGKFFQKAKIKKTDLRYGKRTDPGYENRTSSGEFLGTETVPLSVSKTVPLSISRADAGTSAAAGIGHNAGPPLIDDGPPNPPPNGHLLPDDDLSIPSFLRRN